MTDWRLIIDAPRPGAVNMATDEALLSSIISRPEKPPTLRVYAWSEPTVSVGYHQDASRINAATLPVVRRITGGRAVLHHMEVTYSVISPVDLPVFAGGINGSYTAISRAIVAALASIGIPTEFARGRRAGARTRRPGERAASDPACFHTPARYEVMAGGRKLVGSSQRRFKEAFLQHGSIIIDVDQELHDRVFGPGIISRMNWLAGLGRVDPAEVSEALANGFIEELGCRFERAGLDEAETAERDALLEEKFSDPHWFNTPVVGMNGTVAAGR